MNEPKLIFKYTHAEALANGELRLLPVLREKDRMCMPKYIGYRLDEQLKKHGVKKRGSTTVRSAASRSLTSHCYQTES